MKIIKTFILILFILTPLFVSAEYTNKEIENFQKAYEATVGIKVSKEEAKIFLEESDYFEEQSKKNMEKLKILKKKEWSNLIFLLKEQEKEKTIWKKFLDLISFNKTKKLEIENFSLEEIQQATTDLFHKCVLEQTKTNSTKTHKQVIDEFCGNKIYYSSKSKILK